MSDILPVGSVVRLQDAEELVMVIGFEPTIDDVQADYLGVVFPDGLVTEDAALAFDASSVEEVVFQGFLDDEGEEAFEAVRRYRDLSRDAVAGVEQLIDRLTPQFIAEMREQNAPIPLPEGFEVPEGYVDLPF